MHPGCFSCPLKSSYEDSPILSGEAADLFLALVPETLDFLDGSGLFWSWVCGNDPRISAPPRSFVLSPTKIEGFKMGIFYIQVPRVNPGRRKKDPHDFCWRWRWKGFTARMSMVLLCDNLIISSSIRFLFTGRCPFTLSCELPR